LRLQTDENPKDILAPSGMHTLGSLEIIMNISAPSETVETLSLGLFSAADGQESMVS